MTLNLFLNYAWENPFFYGAWILVTAFSICTHEYAHARVAQLCGDDTAASHGHLTLDPFKQMGKAALLALLVVGIAWGGVPVDQQRLRTRGRIAAAAFAGPATNLLLALISAALWATVVRGDLFDGEAGHVALFFSYAVYANSTLFVFNLLPIPILDGWSVVALLIPSMLKISAQAAAHVSWLVLLLLLATKLGNFVWDYGNLLADLLLRFLGHE